MPFFSIPSFTADSLTYPLIFVLVSFYLFYNIIRVLLSVQPHTHPFLLANQAQFAPVRRPTQSPEFARYGASGGLGGVLAPGGGGHSVKSLAEEREKAQKDGWEVTDLAAAGDKENEGPLRFGRWAEVRQTEGKTEPVVVTTGKKSISATQANVNASLAAHQSLFPPGPSQQPSRRDVILSFFDPSTSAFGLSVVIFGLYTRAKTLIGPIGNPDHPPAKIGELLPKIIEPVQPSLLYLPAPLALSLHTHLLSVLQTRFPSSSSLSSLLLRRSRAAKLASLRKGVIARETIWDNLVFSKLGHPLGKRCRAVFVVGDPLPTEVIDDLRVFLSVPVSHVFTHDSSLGPLAGSQLFDLQSFPSDAQATSAHVGTVAGGVLGKVVDVPEGEGQGVKGELAVRGAIVLGGEAGEEGAKREREDGWLRTGKRVEVRSNGTLVVLA